MSELRDHALVKSVLAGDSRAFAQLVSRYQSRIHSLGMSFFKNTADTDDFVQEVFIKAYTHLASFRFESQFSTWLTRIAYNLALNAVNRRKLYLSLSDDMEVLDDSAGPEEKLLRSVTAESIREILAEIPERYAVCLDMYFFYDMSYNEISEVIDMPVNTIKSHIFRAKKLLRAKLQDLLQAGRIQLD